MTILLADMEAAAYRRKPEDIKWLVIHHSGTAAGNVESFRRYHKEVYKWSDVGYHYVVTNGNGGPDGEVQPGRDELLSGAHCVPRNFDSIGICLVGNFDLQKPTTKQQEALLRLCVLLCRQYSINPLLVVGHNECDATDCPGKNFDIEEFRNRLREEIDAEKGKVGNDPLVGKRVDDVAEVYLDGRKLRNKAIIIGGVGYAPVRELAEAFGRRVDWRPGRIDISR